jgi:hypothetical protein
MENYHEITEKTLVEVPQRKLQWTLLCVAWMYSKDKKIVELSAPQQHRLIMRAGTPPDWQDSWVRSIPVVGVYLNLFPVIKSYWTYLEDVADMIAEHLEPENQAKWAGEIVGFKSAAKSKEA